MIKLSAHYIFNSIKLSQQVIYPNVGANVAQGPEQPEEINEEMETRDMEGFTPGQDNLVINKNEIDDIVADLEKSAILSNSRRVKAFIQRLRTLIKEQVYVKASSNR